MKSHHKHLLEVFPARPSHPKLGHPACSLPRCLSSLPPSRCPCSVETPHGAVYYLTPGALTNCHFPQLAFLKTTTFVSDNCSARKRSRAWTRTGARLDASEHLHASVLFQHLSPPEEQQAVPHFLPHVERRLFSGVCSGNFNEIFFSFFLHCSKMITS